MGLGERVEATANGSCEGKAQETLTLTEQGREKMSLLAKASNPAPVVSPCAVEEHARRRNGSN